MQLLSAFHCFAVEDATLTDYLLLVTLEGVLQTKEDKLPWVKPEGAMQTKETKEYIYNLKLTRKLLKRNKIYSYKKDYIDKQQHRFDVRLYWCAGWSGSNYTITTKP